MMMSFDMKDEPREREKRDTYDKVDSSNLGEKVRRSGNLQQVE